jgi:hypothetical protein
MRVSDPKLEPPICLFILLLGLNTVPGTQGMFNEYLLNERKPKEGVLDRWNCVSVIKVLLVEAY